MENVLLTGSAGFIGQHVLKTLVQKGFFVIGADLKNLDFGNNYKHYMLDINSPDFEKVFQENDIKYIIHLAANSSVPYSTEHPIEDAETNYLGSIRVCSLGLKYNVARIVAASTAAVYANPRYLPVKETHPPNCLSPYAVTKQSMEYYIKFCGLNYTILRFSNVYGPGQNKKGEAGVVSIFMDAMKNNEDVKIFGDGEQIRDFIYVEDVASAVVEVMTNDACRNTLMNISSCTPTRINDLFSILKTLFKYNKAPHYLSPRAGDIKASILDNSLAKNTFGFETKTGLKEGLQKTVESLLVPANSSL